MAKTRALVRLPLQPLLLIFLSLALASCGSFPSITGAKSPFGGGSNMDRTFIAAAQTWDFDKDGTVTCDEWKNYTLSLIKESDENGDGTLDSSEFQKMAKIDRLFEVADIRYYDLNGDGKVPFEELAGKQNVAFKVLDKNGDCRIDRTETVQVLQIDAPAANSAAPNMSQTGPGRR
ncbi:MAG: EF-hand domain-containing protein [Hyphomicrobium sp.]